MHLLGFFNFRKEECGTVTKLVVIEVHEDEKERGTRTVVVIEGS